MTTIEIIPSALYRVRCNNRTATVAVRHDGTWTWTAEETGEHLGGGFAPTYEGAVVDALGAMNAPPVCGRTVTGSSSVN